MTLRPISIDCISKKARFALVMGLTVFLLLSCGEKEEPATNQSAQSASESFTFFDLGTNSRFSESVRKNLNRQLGNDAIAKRSPLDLEINYYGFLKEYFPSLQALNAELNPSTARRIEHNVVKLMFRYARKKNLPFDYVELSFSNYSRLPLLFKINFKKDEANIVDTLKSKYGEPRRIDWKNKGGQSMYWKKHHDILIVSLVPDQFGNPEYQIRIFFVENIKALLASENAEKEEQQRQRARSGKTAF
ncbi:MAG: hypothetical protein P8185_00105 [Deltaproteobacteria bacterium]|jgi:hypothetical protein